MYRYAAGIDTTTSDAGFHTIALHPNFDVRLGHLDFKYESPYGQIKSAWKITGNIVAWEITIPPNTIGHLLIASTNAIAFTLDGMAIAQTAKVHADGDGIYRLPAGSYKFKATLASAPAIAPAAGTP
jgi:alpha-L-rhamnosidase